MEGDDAKMVIVKIIIMMMMLIMMLMMMMTSLTSCKTITIMIYMIIILH